MAGLKPLIAICGTTGVGKSRLGVELALMLRQEVHKEDPGGHPWRGARIVNADSMQIYTGMNIITNKIPQAERMGVEHLLMDFKQPGDRYSVGQWVHDALHVIEETYKMNQIPIIVGGTSYWIQHLLFPNRLASTNLSPTPLRATTAGSPVSLSLQYSVSKLSPSLLNLWSTLPESPPNAVTHPEDALSLYELLQALDHPVASRWHWRDTRKVLRSLQIMKESNRMPSEIILKPPDIFNKRYRTLCFWLYAQPLALNPRLDARIDDMIKHGLVDEIRSLQQIFSSSHTADELDSSVTDPDYTLGIYQCIGFKEFREFLSSAGDSEEVFDKAVANMKQSTRKYAKRQVTWLRNKLLPAIESTNRHSGNGNPVASMYVLDATVLGDRWISNVLFPAESIAKSFLREEDLPPPASLSPIASAMSAHQNRSVIPSDVLQARRKVVCRVCSVDPRRPVMIEEQDLDVHRTKRLHRRLIARSRKREGTLQPLQDGTTPEGPCGDKSTSADVRIYIPA